MKKTIKKTKGINGRTVAFEMPRLNGLELRTPLNCESRANLRFVARELPLVDQV